MTKKRFFTGFSLYLSVLFMSSSVLAYPGSTKFRYHFNQESSKKIDASKEKASLKELWAKRPKDTQSHEYYEKNYERSADNFEPLSMSKGLMYGFLPVNGLGLWYAGKRPLAIWLMSIEASGVLLMAATASYLNDDDDLAKMIFYYGLANVAITYILDASLTPHYISRHNRHLRANQAKKKKILPYFHTFKGHYQVGAHFSF